MFYCRFVIIFACRCAASYKTDRTLFYMKYFRLLIIIVILCFPALAKAQFYTVGDDPGRLKWYSIETPGYKIIYPSGLDSLARVYGGLLEKYRIPVSRSAGYAPGEMTRVKMPVILHAYNAQSNGSVAWAPKRIDLFTSPEGYEAEAMPWADMLAIHESRHVAQMQFGMSNAFKPFKWIFGEMFAGAMAGVYPGQWMLEGDAVVAETALTTAGRGRSGDFLNYYMAAFDSGDFGNWNRWRYGSYRYYTPDHYALGYMALSGIRYRTGKTDITGTYLQYFSKRPYDVISYRTVSRKLTGKGFRKTFDDTMRMYHDIWSEEKEQRAPFIPSVQISDTARIYTEYSDIVTYGDKIYALKSSLDKSKALVMTDNTGKEKVLTFFGNISGPLWHAPGSSRIWWSENIYDERWTQKINSVIMYYDLEKDRKRTFKKDGKRFCPTTSPSGKYLVTVEYPVKGGSGIEILEISNGRRAAYINAPDSLQIIEALWLGDRIFMTGISEKGYSLYSTGIPEMNLTGKATGSDNEHTAAAEQADRLDKDNGTAAWNTLLAPQPVKIRRLQARGNELLFTSDKNGVNELYSFSTESGKLRQLTSTAYGATDFCFSEDGKTLYYAASTADGKLLKCTRSSDLLDRETGFSDIHRYRIADEMSRQEKELAETFGRKAREQERDEKDDMADSEPGNDGETAFSQPERYRKAAHLFNIHSWAPVYFNVDNIMEMSYDNYYDLASLGAAAVFQNHLGTMTGQIGYSAHQDPYDTTAWRHSGHVKFTYTGLYTVIEASVDFNDRASRDYSFNRYNLNGTPYMMSMTGAGSEKPYVQGNLTVYIPFNLSSGGWSRGIIPQVSYTLTNDRYDTGIIDYDLIPDEENANVVRPVPTSREDCKTILRQRLSGSLRMYTMRNTATSEIYPDWGIGMETGVSFNPGLAGWFSPVGYLYLYGYLPGITPNQGLRLSGIWQRQLKGDSIFDTGTVNTLPRGLSNLGDLSNTILSYRQSAKVTADYAIPIYLGDFSIGPVFYGKRALLTPHFDWTFFKGGGLYSVGASLQIEFGCFFWIGAPVSIGVTWSYNGGPSWNSFVDRGIPMNRNYIGPVFSLSLP